MEKTLKEMLHELQCFMINSIDLCEIEGNHLGKPYWRIRYTQTIGGEKFKFSQPDWLGNEGSGIYFDTIPEAIEYAQGCVRKLFEEEAKNSPSFRIIIKDASAYDWRSRGGLAEI